MLRGRSSVIADATAAVGRSTARLRTRQRCWFSKRFERTGSLWRARQYSAQTMLSAPRCCSPGVLNATPILLR